MEHLMSQLILEHLTSEVILKKEPVRMFVVQQR